jgi:diaminopimelate epimerase
MIGAMEIAFTKMQGLGNDFVLIDALRSPVKLTGELARRLADRRFGVGCDQVLLLEPPVDGRADVRFRIFNADGGEVGQCGNGARCVARYLQRSGRARGDTVCAETGGGLVTLHLERDGQVRAEMGVPRFEPEAIPLRLAAAERYTLDVDGVEVAFSALSMGNPHAVVRVADVEAAPVATLGPGLQRHPAFPESVNVGFMQILDRGHIRLRVYERGAGETLACGTGACAAVVAGWRGGELDGEVDVALRGGHLRVEWAGTGQAVWMTGPAEFVFEGRIEL